MNILEHFDHFDKNQDKEHFMNLVQVAMADGKIHLTESQMLHRFGRKMGFTDPEIELLIELSCKTVFNPPYELSKRFEQTYDIVKMILADDFIDKNEMRLAINMASKAGFNDSEIPGLLSLLVNGIIQGKDEEVLFEEYKKQRRD
jgi:hypothetical protein